MLYSKQCSQVMIYSTQQIEALCRVYYTYSQSIYIIQHEHKFTKTSGHLKLATFHQQHLEEVNE